MNHKLTISLEFAVKALMSCRIIMLERLRVGTDGMGRNCGDVLSLLDLETVDSVVFANFGEAPVERSRGAAEVPLLGSLAMLEERIRAADPNIYPLAPPESELVNLSSDLTDVILPPLPSDTEEELCARISERQAELLPGLHPVDVTFARSLMFWERCQPELLGFGGVTDARA
jgi:hypothetical protein